MFFKGPFRGAYIWGGAYTRIGLSTDLYLIAIFQVKTPGGLVFGGVI